ncbi:MAG: hypothetical protein WC693_03030 [Patescibacteria group bacterium]|jgi:hypothetical protein
MKKLALILGAIVIALFCLVVGNWYFSKSEDSVIEAISETEAINTLKNRFPELKSYPSDNLPPKSILTEKTNNGWYIAFILQGSGVPVIDAQCFLMKNDKTITSIDYTKRDSIYGQFSAKECMLIDDEGIEEDKENCALETCHGLEIECGNNSPDVCTMMYQIGDKCLQYAQCGVLNGQCQSIKNSQFTQCATCVQDCIDKYTTDSSTRLFECESSCN